MSNPHVFQLMTHRMMNEDSLGESLLSMPIKYIYRNIYIITQTQTHVQIISYSAALWITILKSSV